MTHPPRYLRLVAALMFCTIVGAGRAVAAVEIKLDIPSESAMSATIVIDDASGQRVRNLPPAKNPQSGQTITWDGRDDAGNSVAPGVYRWRGLWHEGLKPIYQMHYYNAGSVPWEIDIRKDGVLVGAGGWGTDHGGPSGVAIDPTGTDPRVFLSWFGGEGSSWLFPVNSEGTKLGRSVCDWIGARRIAVDGKTGWETTIYAVNDRDGNGLPADVVVQGHLLGDKWPTPIKLAGEIRLARDPNAPSEPNAPERVTGIAASGGRVVLALGNSGQLRVYRVTRPEPLRLAFELTREIKIDQPNGISFGRGGALYCISGAKIVRVNPETGQTDDVITAGLDRPRDLIVDPSERLFVLDHVDSTVRLFGLSGKMIRSFGTPGGRQPGRHDRSALLNPRSIALDHEGQLWVAEDSLLPKRYVVFNAESGEFVREHLGPPQYGGAGTMDPRDPTRLFYAGLEFKADWDAGTTTLVADHHMEGDSSAAIATQQIVHVNDRTYCITFNGGGFWAWNPIIHIERDGRFVPVATAGRAVRIKEMLATQMGAQARTANDDLHWGVWNWGRFVWSDVNLDGKKEPSELQHRHHEGDPGPDTGKNWVPTWVGPDLSLYAVVNNANKQFSLLRVPVSAFTSDGVPTYDLDRPQVIIDPIPQHLTSFTLGVTWVDDQGVVYLTSGDANTGIGYLFAVSSKGQLLWTRRLESQGHNQVKYDLPPGSLSQMRKIAGMATPGKGEAGPVLMPVTAEGVRHLITSDGIYVGHVFQNPLKSQARVPETIAPGDSLEQAWCRDEQWGDHFISTPDGRCILFTGVGPGVAGVVVARIDGLETVKRLSGGEIRIGDAEAADTESGKVDPTVDTAKRPPLRVTAVETPPTIDGKLDEWAADSFVEIKSLGDRGFAAALAVDQKHLYLAYRIHPAETLKNAGGDWTRLFKSGGSVDFQFGPVDAPRDRAEPAPGDKRLLIAKVRDEPIAVLYDPHAADGNRVTFETKVATTTFGDVRRIEKAQVVIHSTPDGHVVEAAIPIEALGSKVDFKMPFLGDVGTIFADSTGQTNQLRLYWSNRQTDIISDAPTEARLSPNRWSTINP
jgi:hypothetical protein